MHQLQLPGGVTVYGFQTGTVSVRQTHFQHDQAPFLRFPKLLLDSRWTADLPIWVWLIRTPHGNYLVDTGENTRVFDADYFGPDQLNRFINRSLLRLKISPDEQIDAQLARVGLSPADIDAVMLTHLHLDHTDGLRFFPNAAVLVSRAHWERPYGAARTTFPGWFKPTLIDYVREDGPFGAAHAISKLLKVVPTPGHTFGHQSVLLEADGRSILFAGDTSFTEQQLLTGTLGGIVIDWSTASKTLALIRALARQHPLIYLPSHDPESGQRLAQQRVVGAAT